MATAELALFEVSTLTPAVVFTPKGADDVLERVTREAREAAAGLDISRPEDRKAIASLAYKVAKSKTCLDDMGKTLVAEWKEKSKAVDAERKRFRDELDKLRDEIRAPLDEWEGREQSRVMAHTQAIESLEASAFFPTRVPDSPDILHRIETLEIRYVRDWEEFGKRAREVFLDVKGRLEAMFTATRQAEKDREELARHRREEQERLARERDERLKAEAAARATAEAEAKAKRLAEMEAARVAADARKAESERLVIEEAKREAEARAARAEAARKEEAARAEAARIAAQAMAEASAKRAAELAERAKREAEARAERAESERVAAEVRAKEAARLAAEQAERAKQQAIAAERNRIAIEERDKAAAAAKREANEKHKAKVDRAVLDAMEAAGVDRTTGVVLIAAINAGRVPHVKISY